MTLKQVIPVLRIFDENKAKEFYLQFLGFNVDWEHRFEADLPLYLQVSLDRCVLHLSEHHGDCSPGALVRIELEDIELFRTALSTSYPYARPGIEERPWGTRELSVTDPFFNKLIFYQHIPSGMDGGL